MAGQLLTSSQLNSNHSNSTSNLNACTQGSQQQSGRTDAGDMSNNNKITSLTIPNVAVKKQGVSGESSDATGQSSRDILIRKFEKDFR